MKRTLGVSVLLFFGLAFVVGGIAAQADHRRYQDASVTVQGTVIAVESLEPRRRQNPKSTRVTYRFTTRDGRELRGTDLVAPQTREQLREGGPVSIQYLTVDPTRSQIPEVGEGELYGVWTAIGVVFSVVGLVWMCAPSWGSSGRAPSHSVTVAP